MIDPHDGLLVIGDAAIPLDEKVIQAPNAPHYAGPSTLIHFVTD